MKYLLIIFALLFSHYSFAQDDIAQKLDKIVDEYYKMDIFSGTVIVVKDDTPVFEKAVGYSSRGSKTPNNIETIFNIGSIQKTFTKVLLLQLIQDGRLDLNDKLGKYVTGFSDPRAENATIKEIMIMMGGFGDYLNNPDIAQNPDRYSSISDILAEIKKEPLLFDPGTKEMYSNSGYVVLGGVLEKIYGKTYSEILKEKILDPLGMNRSLFIRNDAKAENKAVGYMIAPDGNIMDVRQFNVAPTSAGGMFSNVYDLLKFGQSLMEDNKLLNDEHKFLLYDLGPGGKSNYSSWKSIRSSNSFGVGWAGGSPGWNSMLVQRGSSPRYTVIVLSNYDEPSAEALYSQIRNILNSKEPETVRLPLERFVYNEIKSRGIDDFTNNFEKIFSENGYVIRDDLPLNMVGYALLQNDLINEAIAVFKLNVKLYPNIPNCYDSLGEAYMVGGNKEEAIKNYETVLKMQPGNKNAQQMLDKLNAP